MPTREEKVERHFRNSVRDALLDLMEVLDPGEHLLWRSYNQKDLLKAAKERIEAELLHETGFAEDSANAKEIPVSEKQTALALPK